MTRQTNYWIQREQKNIGIRKKTQKQLEKEIDELYLQTMKEIQKDINDLLSNYAEKEKVTMSEVRKRASDMEVEQFSLKAKHYVKNKDFSSQANRELRLYNLKMKTSRLELARQKLLLEAVSSSDELEKILSKYLSKEAVAEFERQSGILGTEFSNIRSQAKTIVEGSFQNATFSERIWGILQTDLRTSLERLLSKALIQGQNPVKIARELKNLFDVTNNQAKRLARTELARVQTEVQKKSYKAAEIDCFIFIREVDACQKCKSVTKKPIELKDFRVGMNAAPIHPNCRCSTAPYFDREEFEKYLEDKGL